MSVNLIYQSKKQRLIFVGQEVLNHQKLSEIGIQEQSSMHLVESLDTSETVESVRNEANIDEMFRLLSKLLIDNSRTNYEAIMALKKENKEMRDKITLLQTPDKSLKVKTHSTLRESRKSNSNMCCW